MSQIRSLCLRAAGLAVLMSAGQAAAQTHDLVVTRVFDAPVNEVWSAWSTAESITQWWGPHGFTVPVAEMDFREGGRSIVCMQPEGGPPMCNNWSYSEIVPNERIVFVMGWIDEEGNEIDPRSMGLPDDIPKVVPHLVGFRALPDGRTELTVSEFGYRSEETVALSKAGLEQVMDKLAASLQ